MNKYIAYLGWLFFAIATVFLFTRGTRDESEDHQYVQAFQAGYSVYAVPVPLDITFANEAPPLSDVEVYERLDKEMHVNTYWQSSTLLMFKRAKRFFPVIEPILEKNGVPNDFKYLALIESGLTNAVSPSGAVGFWQMLSATGQEYGLEVTEEVDERYHVQKSTEAACRYLIAAKNKFGSWTLAAASYNMGMTGLAKQLERQKVENYYDILLNSETSRYVFRLMAVKAIMENPKSYGFHFREKDLYLPLEEQIFIADTTIADFADFAREFGITYKTLKFHNPWLRQNYLTVKAGKEYQIALPKKD